MDIWSVHLRPILDSGIDWMRIIPLMNSQLQAKIQKFRQPEDQLRTLCGELLLQRYALERWRIPPSGLVKKYNAYGKPELAEYPSCHYNISHSGDWVVAAFDYNPVGIDIETAANPIEISIAERFFSPTEVSLLQEQNEEQQQSLFYSLWTLKESYIKAEGSGLSIPLDSFSFEFREQNQEHNNEESNNVELYRSDTLDTSWYFKQYRIDPGYALAVCGREPDFPKQVEAVRWDTLISII
ncbi:4'-phosphopantetheinyl transferase superfamily protein [Paenibacillus polygoni]|uniref:4'-phosphopantetheinyl transferase superfamily protein n=1 Tax=Paenibacillus polygoni TaxID=3050112 RepID=A0ABY8WXG9_9BACL|nr:4'-phosphopantetheinyl transferase superfamily protein [Paenibacillus polygoni]WIV17767.1 4'-phosphopantetheinyl transferase superfamily protein [Paenibacillus polygoni]